MGHIRGRFLFKNIDSKPTDLIELDKIDGALIELLKSDLVSSINKFVPNKLSVNVLRDVINANPELLYQTVLPAKSILGFTS